MGRDDEKYQPRRENKHSGAVGGAEAHARFRQYEYGANASLVLTSERRGRAEPSGEPETLWGRIDAKKFGDKVERGRPSDAAGGGRDGDERQKGKKRVRFAGGGDEFGGGGRGARRRAGDSVLNMDSGGLYRPKTRETRAAYEALLGSIQAQIGDQPADVLRGAVDEVLAVLKSDAITRDADRKRALEGLVNAMSAERFDQLVGLGRLVTDYVDPTEAAARLAEEDALDDELGVAVEFDGEDEDEDEDDDKDDADGR